VSLSRVTRARVHLDTWRFFRSSRLLRRGAALLPDLPARLRPRQPNRARQHQDEDDENRSKIHVTPRDGSLRLEKTKKGDCQTTVSTESPDTGRRHPLGAHTPVFPEDTSQPVSRVIRPRGSRANRAPPCWMRARCNPMGHGATRDLGPRHRAKVRYIFRG
jgi:hypothetical protein